MWPIIIIFSIVTAVMAGMAAFSAHTSLANHTMVIEDQRNLPAVTTLTLKGTVTDVTDHEVHAGEDSYTAHMATIEFDIGHHAPVGRIVSIDMAPWVHRWVVQGDRLELTYRMVPKRHLPWTRIGFGEKVWALRNVEVIEREDQDAAHTRNGA